MARTDDPEQNRRPYRSPQLVEYGDIREITQSGGGGADDIPTSQPTV